MKVQRISNPLSKNKFCGVANNNLKPNTSCRPFLRNPITKKTAEVEPQQSSFKTSSKLVGTSALGIGILYATMKLAEAAFKNI